MLGMKRIKLLSALGSAVSERRGEIGISQEVLAERAGLHRTYIGAIERGLRNPTIVTLFKLAEGLGISPEHLVRDAHRNLAR